MRSNCSLMACSVSQWVDHADTALARQGVYIGRWSRRRSQPRPMRYSSQSVRAMRIGMPTTAPMSVRISPQPMSAQSSAYQNVRICH